MKEKGFFFGIYISTSYISNWIHFVKTMYFKPLIDFLKFMLNVFAVSVDVPPFFKATGSKLTLQTYLKKLSENLNKLENYNFKVFKFVELKGLNLL